MGPGIEQRHVTTRHQTRIGYQTRGDGPCVVLANGLGGTHLAFRYLYESLTDHETAEVVVVASSMETRTTFEAPAASRIGAR